MELHSPPGLFAKVFWQSGIVTSFPCGICCRRSPPHPTPLYPIEYRHPPTPFFKVIKMFKFWTQPGWLVVTQIVSKAHGANMEPTWVLSAPCWPKKPCYQGSVRCLVFFQVHLTKLLTFKWKPMPQPPHDSRYLVVEIGNIDETTRAGHKHGLEQSKDYRYRQCWQGRLCMNSTKAVKYSILDSLLAFRIIRVFIKG